MFADLDRAGGTGDAASLMPLHDRAKTSLAQAARSLGLGSPLALWVTIDSAAVVTANGAAALIPANVPEYFGCSPGQVLNFISTSTSTGYVTLTEMT